MQAYEKNSCYILVKIVGKSFVFETNVHDMIMFKVPMKDHHFEVMAMQETSLSESLIKSLEYIQLGIIVILF